MDATIGHRREGPSIERAFEGQPLPAWWEQITMRSLVASVVLGSLFSFVSIRLHLSSGIAPSMNLSAALLGFFFLKSWTGLLERCGIMSRPFTRQENTVVQTCIIACTSISFSGGFGTYALAMSKTVAKKFGMAKNGNNMEDLTLGQWIAFLFLTSFVGIFSIVPLRKIMIIDFKLMYPSGLVTGHLINSFHTPQGALSAKLQLAALLRSFAASFFWSFIQWFYTAGKGCGFKAFPMFGLQAYKRRFYFDFSASYVGLGMICPYLVNMSLLLGAIISWGIMWPFLETKKGKWYTDESETSLTGLTGYKVFIGVALILGDGLFHLCAIVIRATYDFYDKCRQQEGVLNPYSNVNYSKPSALSYDDRRRTQMFLKDQIPNFVAAAGYVGLAATSICFIPRIFTQLKYYHVASAYIIAPLFAFCNAYGSGLTDWSLTGSYGKLAIFIYGAWVGEPNGGIVASLAACGVMMGAVSTAADLMHDFKTGYLTLTSPRSMFISQVIGTVLGCIVNPIIFMAFLAVSKKKESLGLPGSTFSAPLAMVYRGIALSGFVYDAGLPKHCIPFCIAFFVLALAINAVKILAQQNNWWIQDYIPSAMAMAVPFLLGPFFAIDMCVGSLILFVWTKIDSQSAELLVPVVSSGLICGDGIWQLPSSLLALLDVKPPICMKFLSGEVNKKVDGYLTS